MKSVYLYLSLILGMLCISFGSCSKDSSEKIAEQVPISPDDREAVFEYLNKILDDENFGSNDSIIATNYPQMQELCIYMAKSNDPETSLKIDTLIYNARQKGKMKVYSANPVYVIMSNRPGDLPASTLQAEAMQQYLSAALNSGLSGEKLEASFPNMQSIINDWSSSSDSLKISTVREALKSAIPDYP